MRRVAAALFALATAAVAGACGDDGGSPAEGYCGQVDLHLDTLNSPDIDTEAEIAETLAIYRAVRDAAPVAVEAEWTQVLGLIEAASTTDRSDPAAMQHLADVGRSARPAVTRVQQYTLQVCGLPIDTPPQVTNPVTATTVATSSATATAPTATAPTTAGG